MNLLILALLATNLNVGPAWDSHSKFEEKLGTVPCFFEKENSHQALYRCNEQAVLFEYEDKKLQQIKTNSTAIFDALNKAVVDGCTAGLVRHREGYIEQDGNQTPFRAVTIHYSCGNSSVELTRIFGPNALKIPLVVIRK